MRHANKRILVTVTCLLLGCIRALADGPGIDADALERSLQMLHLEMKVNVLQTYYARGGFYITPQWTKAIQDDYQKLAEETGKAASLKNANVDDWLAESRKTRDNEVLAMYKLVEDNIPKLMAWDKTSAEDKQFEQQLAQWQRDHNKDLVVVARYVEGLVKPIADANRGKADSAVEILWWRSARNLYRGSIKDTDDLVTSIAAYDQKRLDLESRLVLLKEYETGLDIAKAAQDPVKKMIDTASEKSLEKAQEYFKTYYTDIDPDKVKKMWGNRKSELEQMWALNSKLTELDNDDVLKGNPNAKAIAKRFAIMGALYNYTFGRVKDTAIMKAMGPLADFLEFYGEAIKLIPDVAIKIQSVTNKTDQDLHNVRALDPWNVTGLPPGDLRQLTMFDSFSLHIGTDASIDDLLSANARYYLLVDKSVVPRGFATLSADEFTRMTDTVSYERFINAPAEASRGIGEWVSENMFEWRSTSALSAVASDAYLSDLKKMSRALSLTEKDLLDLAHNLPVTYQAKQWTADSLKAEADRKLDARAEEMTVRTALPNYRDSYLKEWQDFKAMLRKNKVALTPPQILKLFAYYHNSGANAQHLEKYLKTLSDERDARARGIPKAGVPLVTSSAHTGPIASGAPATLSATVIVSNLAPARQVKAKAVWTLPAGATAPAPTEVTIANGAIDLTCAISMPKTAHGDNLQAKLTLKVPVEKGEVTVAEVTTSLAKTATGTPAAKSEVASESAAFHDYVGTGLFDVQHAELQITTRRLYPYGITGIDILTAAIDGLDAKKPNEGLKFTLYRATDPGGPWVNPDKPSYQTDDGALLLYPDTKFVTESQRISGRLDKDRVMLTDSRRDPGILKPFYYRVGQTGFLREGVRGHSTGKEVLSNVVAPSQDYRVLLYNPNNKEKPEAPIASHEYSTATIMAALSIPDQAFDIVDTHFTVISGAYVGHCWGPKIYGGFTPMKAPYRPEGQKLEISAEGQGRNASITVTVPPDEKRQAEVQKQLADYQTRIEKAVADAIKSTADHDQKTRAAETALAAFKDTGDVNSAISSYDLQSELIGCRYAARSFKEYQANYTPLYDQVQLAEVAQDGKKVLELRRRQLELAKVNMDLMIAVQDEREALLRKSLQRADLPETRRSYYQSCVQSCDGMRKDARGRYRQDQLAAIGGMARSALLVGDPVTYLKSQCESMRGQIELKQADTIAGMLGQVAEPYATVSGDRQMAARLMLVSVGANLATHPDQADQIKKYLEDSTSPNWWPRDVEYKVPAAWTPSIANIDALEKEALQSLEQLKTTAATRPMAIGD